MIEEHKLSNDKIAQRKWIVRAQKDALKHPEHVRNLED
jgi:hypothetical protein